jgi:hypothetical protein
VIIEGIPVTYALTLHRPWCWAICHAGKCTENRSWVPPRKMLHAWIGIHSGRRWDRDAELWLSYRFERLFDGCGTQGPVPPMEVDWPGGRLVALAQIVGWDREIRTEWDAGPWCWRLGLVHELAQPIAMPGRQGLWTIARSAAR